jgi:hypothetical protein
MAIKVYEYTDDVGNKIPVRMDEAKAAIGGFTAASTASGVMGPTPLNRVRGVYAKNDGGQSLFIPCATKDLALFIASTSQLIDYKAASYFSVSSRGEKRLHGATTVAP